MNRPQAFWEWWQWGREQADACRKDEPTRLHQDAFQEGGHPGPWRKRGQTTDRNPTRGSTISPQPFTPDFESYLDAEPEWGPMRVAMARMYNPRRAQIHEYRILFALLEGHTDAETVRALIGGCRKDFFEAAAIRAFSAVFEIAKSMLPLAEPVVRSTQPNTRRGPASPRASGSAKSIASARPREISR